jgi:hypothetical protein
MKIDNTFVRAVTDACEDSLVQRGFKRLKRNLVVLPVSDDFMGWTGLNIGKHDGFIRVNPFVGVHCVPAMRLIDELSGEKYQIGRYATYSIPLGELCPQIEVFEFSPDTDLQSEAGRLAETYEEFGKPFILKNSNYEEIMPKIHGLVPFLGGNPQRYASLLFLSGHKDAAIEFVESKRLEFSENRAIGEIFERFAGPFLSIVRRDER